MPESGGGGHWSEACSLKEPPSYPAGEPTELSLDSLLVRFDEAIKVVEEASPMPLKALRVTFPGHVSVHDLMAKFDDAIQRTRDKDEAADKTDDCLSRSVLDILPLEGEAPAPGPRYSPERGQDEPHFTWGQTEDTFEALEERDDVGLEAHDAHIMSRGSSYRAGHARRRSCSGGEQPADELEALRMLRSDGNFKGKELVRTTSMGSLLMQSGAPGSRPDASDTPVKAEGAPATGRHNGSRRMSVSMDLPAMRLAHEIQDDIPRSQSEGTPEPESPRGNKYRVLQLGAPKKASSSFEIGIPAPPEDTPGATGPSKAQQLASVQNTQLNCISETTPVEFDRPVEAPPPVPHPELLPTDSIAKHRLRDTIKKGLFHPTHSRRNTIKDTDPTKMPGMYSKMRGRSKLGDVVTSKSSSYMFVTALVQGIRTSLQKPELYARAVTEPLSQADFDFFVKEKFVLDRGVRYKFKDYSPQVFRQLRHMFGVDDESYLASVGVQEGLSEISTVDTGSKSGQKFLISHDARYFMKTTTASEARFFMKNLLAYYSHMKDYRNSLLCRFFGLHRIKPGKMHLLVMGNIFDTDRIIHQRYDLKGSTVGRSVSEEDRSKATVILKDLDFLTNHSMLRMGTYRKNILITQVKADCGFLQSLGVMDYSLLLGVHFRSKRTQDIREENLPPTKSSEVKNPKAKLGQLQKTGSLLTVQPEQTHTSDFQQHDGGWSSQDTVNGVTVTGNQIYFVGIIDYLQYYNTKKRAETFIKGFTYNRREISAVDPKLYASRFINFMDSIID